MVESYIAMRRRNPDVKLVLVGDGPQRAQLAKRFPEIIMAGARTGIDLATHYASAWLDQLKYRRNVVVTGTCSHDANLAMRTLI